MSQIEKNQLLEVENLYCFRGKVDSIQLEKIGKDLEQVVTESGAKRVGNPITATFSIDGTQADVEVMLPVDRKIADTEKFHYKEKLKIVNAVKARHIGNPGGLQNTCEELNQYIIDNRLTPITVGYNVTKCVDMIDVDNTQIEVYVGISPNVL